MKIDSHQHFWKYDPQVYSWITEDMRVLKRDFMPEDLHPLLQQHNFDGCVVVQADCSDKETDFLLDHSEKHAFIKGVVGWFDLCEVSIGHRLEKYASFEKLKGLRHSVQSEADGYMLRADFQKGIAALEQYDFTYDILIFPHQLEEAIHLVKSFPKQKFILDHCAKPYIKEGKIENWQKDMEQLARLENVACKVSGLITEADWQTWNAAIINPYLDVVFNNFGTDRTMFGSDWPVSLLAGSYSETLDVVEQYISRLSQTEQQQIMGLNAKTWYNLKE